MAAGRGKELQLFLQSVSCIPSPRVIPVNTLLHLANHCLGLWRTTQAHLANRHPWSLHQGLAAPHRGQHSPGQNPSCCCEQGSCAQQSSPPCGEREKVYSECKEGSLSRLFPVAPYQFQVRNAKRKQGAEAFELNLTFPRSKLTIRTRTRIKKEQPSVKSI